MCDSIGRWQAAQELVSHDIRNNTYNYKDTFSVEIVPLCKDNIVCLPRKLAQKLGNLSQVCVVHRVTQQAFFRSPVGGHVRERADAPIRLALFVGNDPGAKLEPAKRAVIAPHPESMAKGSAPALQGETAEFVIQDTPTELTLRGVDSVMASQARRQRAWDDLAKLLNREHLARLHEVVPMSAVPELAPKILAGEVRGRLVVDVNG